MTLAASGVMSFGGSTATRSINLELGVSATAQRGFNDATSRTLSGTTAGSQVSIFTFYGKSNYTPTTITLTGGSGTYTVPTGATQVVMEAWGGGGQSGQDWVTYEPLLWNGGAGAGGGYSRSLYSCSGGQTFNYAVGGNTTVTSGTLTITSMAANNGGQGGAASDYVDGTDSTTGGTASGGNQANTAGGAASGGVGGNASTGVYGGPYGHGHDASYPGLQAGDPGGIVLRFT